jgi:hypothetical protein
MSSAITFHHGLWTPRHKTVISNIERAVVCCKEWPVNVYKSQNDHELTGEGYSQRLWRGILLRPDSLP